jgi:hypothetical protein
MRPTVKRTLFACAAALGLSFGGAAAAQDMSGMDMPGHPAKPPAETPATPAPDTPSHDMAAMPGMDMGETMVMTGSLGSYPMTREASGTSWQPDAGAHGGIHEMRGPWTFMAHATINGVYSNQSGPRGDDKAFVSGMVMLAARRDLANLDTLNFRAMLSPDPLMGKRGYPLLLATGETADGVTPLVDRQHPHDLFMELSASYTHRFSERDSVFVYGGLPGEPAFGPPAFMHRQSIMESPEAPISHHWLDSTHITFGVVTVGFIHENWKLEASRFHGREPDQFRYNIETGSLDSTAVRLSWNPGKRWALQVSWAEVKSPEQLEPGVNQRRWSASAIYTQPVGAHGWWSTTAAWGRRSAEGVGLNAYVLESALKPSAPWTIFARAEATQNNELTPGFGHPVHDVGKISAGVIHDWRVARHLLFGLGGLYALNFVPTALETAYGGDPHGVMAFVRVKVD